MRFLETKNLLWKTDYEQENLLGCRGGTVAPAFNTASFVAKCVLKSCELTHFSKYIPLSHFA